MLNLIKNWFTSGYNNNPKAIIIACYFNPQRNEYRKKAFDRWYKSIKHLNHFILEAIPTGSKPELPDIIGKIEHIQVDQMLWHKETLLNKIIDRVIEEGRYKYIFWLDTDVIFDNKNWLVDACKELEVFNVVQPFEYCFHLNRDANEPTQDQINIKSFLLNHPVTIAKLFKIWRSFGANVKTNPKHAMSDDYDIHGHVGFAWGANVHYLKRIGGLYDKALIGGADHIMAHAFAGQIPCSCISKSFGDDLDIKEWSRKAYLENWTGNINVVSYVKGNLFHLWHGDIEKREYYKRIKEFTPLSENKIERNSEGFFQSSDMSVLNYFDNYLSLREEIDPPVRGEPGITIADLTGKISEFEGGQFGGSGAGGDWLDNPQFNNIDPTFS